VSQFIDEDAVAALEHGHVRDFMKIRVHLMHNRAIPDPDPYQDGLLAAPFIEIPNRRRGAGEQMKDRRNTVRNLDH